MSTGAIIVGPGRVTISKDIKQDKGKVSAKLVGIFSLGEKGDRNERQAQSGTRSYSTPDGGGCLLCCSEQATSVCALLYHFSKPQSQRCRSSKDAYENWKKNTQINQHVVFFVSLRQELSR